MDLESKEKENSQRNSMNSVNYPSRAVHGTENYHRNKTLVQEPQNSSSKDVEEEFKTPPKVSDGRSVNQENADESLNTYELIEINGGRQDGKTGMGFNVPKSSEEISFTFSNPNGLEYSSTPVPILKCSSNLTKNSNNSTIPGREGNPNCMSSCSNSSSSSYSTLPSRPCRPVTSNGSVAFCNCSLRSNTSSNSSGNTLTSSLVPEASGSSQCCSTLSNKDTNTLTVGDPSYAHYRVPSPILLKASQHSSSSDTNDSKTSLIPDSSSTSSDRTLVNEDQNLLKYICDAHRESAFSEDSKHVYENPMDLECEFCCHSDKGR